MSERLRGLFSKLPFVKEERPTNSSRPWQIDCSKLMAVNAPRGAPSKLTRANIWRGALILCFLALAIISITLSYLKIDGSGMLGWLTVALTNVGPELAGIFIGAVTLDILNEHRQQEQFKGQLIRQMGSPHNEVTESAVRELAAHGWLSNGSLNGQSFRKADLHNCDLSWAQMVKADLESACLRGADLSGAVLTGAELFRADLQDARMVSTILRRCQLQCTRLDRVILHGATLSNSIISESSLVDADLCHAHLENTGLLRTNFTRADLRFANLTGASIEIEQLKQASSLFGTVMPDGVQIGLRGQPTFEEWCKARLA